MTHKSILNIIQKLLFTLATELLKLMSYQTISVLCQPTNSGIASIKLTTHMLLTPEMKKIIVDAASGGEWTSRPLRKVSRTGVDGVTRDSIDNSVSIVETSSPYMI